MTKSAARRDPSQLRIPAEYIEAYLTRRGWSWRDLDRGRAVLETAAGPEVLTIELIEDLLAARDPVIWAWLNLIEREGVKDDASNVVTPAGSSWRLFPVQARMARLKGNTIFECGSEVGKTRDIVLGTLWECDSATTPTSCLIAADSDITLEEIWNEIDFQVDQNPRIGYGVVDEHIKPFREKVFRNGSRFQMRLCGHDGKQFRGGHFSGTVRADEVAKWKNQQQLNELWRAAKPGAAFRLYSTPDGDYSSPFYTLCKRAIPIDDRKPEAAAGQGATDEPRFSKFNITKRDLPPPFWTEGRAAKYREQYGGETSIGWLTNVEGKWGSPVQSVFPMTALRPNLKYLPHYRIAVASIDRDKRTMYLAAARLDPKLEAEDGTGNREEILARGVQPLFEAPEVARAIAAYFPSFEVADWKDPRLFCGADLGSTQDEPSEFLFTRVIGTKWIDVFRLILKAVDYTIQAEILMQLDHAAGHRVRYGIDNGSAGSALVDFLMNSAGYRSCPVCQTRLHLSDRLSAFGFAERIDVFDIETGKPILNPDKHDAGGNEQPHRASNKEFSTRLLERKVYTQDLAIAWDAGAGDQGLSGPQLLINHTVIGVTERGERKFKGENDHHVDARRQAALAIAAEKKPDTFIPATPDVVAVSGLKRPTYQMVELEPLSSLFEYGSVRDGLRDFGKF